MATRRNRNSRGKGQRFSGNNNHKRRNIVERLLDAVREDDKMTMAGLTIPSGEGAIGSANKGEDILKSIARSHYETARIGNITLCRFPSDNTWKVAEFRIDRGKVQLPVAVYSLTSA